MTCPTDSVVFTQGRCMNFNAMKYESTGLNRTVGNKSQVHPGFKKHTTHVFLICELHSNIITFTVEGHSKRVLG